MESIIYRPNSSSGCWLCSLIPITYFIHSIRYTNMISIEYKISTIIVFGLVIKSLEMYWFKSINQQHHHHRHHQTSPRVVPIIESTVAATPDISTTEDNRNFTAESDHPQYIIYIDKYYKKYLFDIILCSFIAFLLVICLKLNIVMSILLGPVIIQSYEFIFCILLKALPKCFTFGEGTIVGQGLTIFLSNVFLKFVKRYWHSSTIASTTVDTNSNVQQIQMILQVSLTGLFLLICLTYSIKTLRNPILFTASTLIVIIGICLFPITDNNDYLLIVLIRFIFGDYKRIIITIIYLALISLAVLIVAIYVNRNTSSSTTRTKTQTAMTTTTRTRKLFHLLIVLVYVPGIIYQCVYVFIASGLFLGILIYLEMLRLIKFPYLSDVLNVAVHTFIDDKDSGAIALTPIYLLIGCSIPIWLHPFACCLECGAITDGFIFIILLAGILSVGIGDTAASYFGSKYGKHKWKNSSKSIEGLIGSIVFQGIFIISLYYLEIVYFTRVREVVKIIMAILMNAFVEAETDQIDNLLLPLITFIILL